MRTDWQDKLTNFDEEDIIDDSLMLSAEERKKLPDTPKEDAEAQKIIKKLCKEYGLL